MKKLMLVGSNGFIGSNLSTYLANKFELFVYNERINNSSLLHFQRLISDLDPEYIINCIGSGIVGHSFSQPLADFEKNAQTVIYLLESIRVVNRNIQFIHFSSAAVYGNPTKEIISEESNLNPISPYGSNKLISEEICNNYARNFEINIHILRPFSVYGEGQMKMLLWDILQKIDQGEVVELYGTGEETRDFIHIKDLCRIVELIVNNPQKGIDYFNLANGMAVRIDEVSKIFSNLFPNKLFSFKGDARVGDPNSWCANITKLKNLGYIQEVSLEKGIEDYVKWYRDKK